MEPAKPVVWMGDSDKVVRSFPQPVRQEIGFELFLVQQGDVPRDWKPMRAIGAGVVEIRVHAGSEYRVLYVAKFRSVIHVLHAFIKKTPKDGSFRSSTGRATLPGARFRGGSMKTKRTKGSSNVFSDLGFGPAEAANLRIRSEMMAALIADIEQRGLTQSQAARLFGITQPRVSNLMQGKIQLFSIDTLVKLLGKAGLRVNFKLTRAA
jgi:phage-related protein/predicted XRE-type DNA-binding protein